VQKISQDVLSSLAGVPSVGAAGEATLAVASTADVITHSHDISGSDALVLWYKATVTSGTPDVDLYLQQGPILPTAQGVAGNAVDGWIQIGNKIADIVNENWNYVTLSPVPMPFLRILADGQGSNPASCKLAFRLGRQDLFS